MSARQLFCQPNPKQHTPSSKGHHRKPSVVNPAKRQETDLQNSGSTLQSPYFGNWLHGRHTHVNSSLQSIKRYNKSSHSCKIKIKSKSPLTDKVKSPSMTPVLTRRIHTKKSDMKKSVILTPKPKLHQNFVRRLDTPPMKCKMINLSLSPRAFVNPQPAKFKLDHKKKSKAPKKEAKRLGKIKMIESVYFRKQSTNLMPYVRPFL